MPMVGTILGAHDSVVRRILEVPSSLVVSLGPLVPLGLVTGLLAALVGHVGDGPRVRRSTGVTLAVLGTAALVALPARIGWIRDPEFAALALFPAAVAVCCGVALAVDSLRPGIATILLLAPALVLFAPPVGWGEWPLFAGAVGVVAAMVPLGVAVADGDRRRRRRWGAVVVGLGCVSVWTGSIVVPGRIDPLLVAMGLSVLFVTGGPAAFLLGRLGGRCWLTPPRLTRRDAETEKD